MVQHNRDVRFVPKADMALFHSINPSAIERREGGTVRPSILCTDEEGVG
jgi:hypothetical protein